jgi:hypothetical protein
MSTARGVMLTERDVAILEHVHQYRITTIDVLHRLFWEPGRSVNAVSQVIARLGAFLHDAPLLGPQRYYLLTPAAARDFGEAEEFARPLGASSLAHHYAMLEYCCMGEEAREHLTPRELREGFPGLDGRGMARNRYFLTKDQPPRLGWLEVDCGNNAETRARKCQRQFAKRYNAPSLKFRELADRGQFGIVLVTTSEGKRRALERVFRKLESFPVQVCVSDALRQLLGREDMAREAGRDEDRSDEDG